MIAHTLQKLEAGCNLTRVEADTTMEELLAGRMAHEEIVRLLRALRAKGETVEELVGFAQAMRRHARPIVIRTAASGTVSDAAPGVGRPMNANAAFVAEFPLVDT